MSSNPLSLLFIDQRTGDKHNIKIIIPHAWTQINQLKAYGRLSISQGKD